MIVQNQRLQTRSLWLETERMGPKAVARCLENTLNPRKWEPEMVGRIEF